MISPSTAALDRVTKLAIYPREKVTHAWVVDPLAPTLEALRLEHGHWVIVDTWAGDATLRVEPFETLEWDLGLLWAQPSPERSR